MTKAKQRKEALQSGGKMDNVIMDYLWKTRYNPDERAIARAKGINLLADNGKHYVKTPNRFARVLNPKTGKVETVDIREHNKAILGKTRKAGKDKSKVYTGFHAKA